MKTWNLNPISFIIVLMASMFFNIAIGEDKKLRSPKKDHQLEYILLSVDFTQQEAEKFIEIFRKYKKAKKALRATVKESKISQVQIVTLENEEIDNMIHHSFNYSKKLINLNEQYYTELKKSLPIKKVAKVLYLQKNSRNRVLKNTHSKDFSKPQGKTQHYFRKEK